MSKSSRPAFEEEAQMYRAWEEQMLPGIRLSTLDGRAITIVSAGIRNLGPGPDYHGAVLLIDGHIASGPVEMHLREVDWFLHGHHNDRRYDTVILHVIASDHRYGARPTGIPTLLLTSEKRPALQADPSPVDTSDISTLLSDHAWERFLQRSAAFLEGGVAPLSIEALLPHLFDALGYASNRRPMVRTATILVTRGISGTPEEMLTSVIASACFPQRVTRQLHERFGLTTGDGEPESEEDPSWNFSVRPENRPERRIIAGAVLIHRITSENLLLRFVERLRTKQSNARSLARLLRVHAKGTTFLGTSRAADIVVNVLLPACTAHAIRSQDVDLLHRVLHTYRHHPPLSANRRTREFERRFLGGSELPGAFEQQGAIELLKRTSGA